MEQKIGYKVLRKNRRSIIQYFQYGGLHYPKLKEVKPREYCGPLCVFTSRERALMFSSMLDSFVVKCTYIQSQIRQVWFPMIFESYPFRSLEVSTVNLHSLPTGTVLADSVTCLE